jgi:hypothetical protein
VVIPATSPFGSPGVFGAVVDPIEGPGYDDVWFGDHAAMPSRVPHITELDWLELMSPSTVKTQPEHIFAKIRVGSRAALAARFARRNT